MHFTQNGFGDSLLIPRPSGRQGQDGAAESRCLQYTENKPQNVSLVLYPLDEEKVHRMKAQAAYKERLLSDRTLRGFSTTLENRTSRIQETDSDHSVTDRCIDVSDHAGKPNQWFQNYCMENHTNFSLFL